MTEINQTSAKSNSLSTSNTNTTIKPEFDHKFKLMMLGNNLSFLKSKMPGVSS